MGKPAITPGNPSSDGASRSK